MRFDWDFFLIFETPYGAKCRRQRRLLLLLFEKNFRRLGRFLVVVRRTLYINRVSDTWMASIL